MSHPLDRFQGLLVKEFSRGGVPQMLGTDTSFPGEIPGVAVHQELASYVAARGWKRAMRLDLRLPKIEGMRFRGSRVELRPLRGLAPLDRLRRSPALRAGRVKSRRPD